MCKQDLFCSLEKWCVILGTCIVWTLKTEAVVSFRELRVLVPFGRLRFVEVVKSWVSCFLKRCGILVGWRSCCILQCYMDYYRNIKVATKLVYYGNAVILVDIWLKSFGMMLEPRRCYTYGLMVVCFTNACNNF